MEIVNMFNNNNGKSLIKFNFFKFRKTIYKINLLCLFELYLINIHEI